MTGKWLKQSAVTSAGSVKKISPTPKTSLVQQPLFKKHKNTFNSPQAVINKSALNSPENQRDQEPLPTEKKKCTKVVESVNSVAVLNYR